MSDLTLWRRPSRAYLTPPIFHGYFFTDYVPPLQNVVTTMTGGWALRQLTTSSTMNLITIRRSSDSSTTNIGITSGGTLDTAAIAAFCSSQGYVTTIFDQVSTNNFVQATSSNQPIIYNSTTGVVTGCGGQPAMQFNGTDSWFTNSNASVTTVVWSSVNGGTGIMVGRLTAAPAAGNFNDTAGLVTDGVVHGLGVAWDNTPRVATGNDIITASISVAAYPHSDIIAFRSTSFGAAANTFYLNYNGGTATSGSDGGGRAIGAANMFIGKNIRPTYLTGTLSEWYTTNQYLPPSDMNTIGTNIDAFFSGTNPVSWTNVSS